MHVAELWRFPVKSMAGEPRGRRAPAGRHSRCQSRRCPARLLSL